MLDKIYWIRLFKELRMWYRFARITKSQRTYLEENNMRVDWLGRIYTVINMPEEIANNQQRVQEGWVISQLKPMNTVMDKIGVADVIFPEMERIPEPGTAAFLIAMYPNFEEISFWKFIWNIILYTGIYWLIKIIIKLVPWAPVWEFISNL
jgi:hypothetical protein